MFQCKYPFPVLVCGGFIILYVEIVENEDYQNKDSAMPLADASRLYKGFLQTRDILKNPTDFFVRLLFSNKIQESSRRGK